jgi:hypothetical protein|tara:strand:+ start:2091 stop:2282 length:192 start_codon:yes stop_codon:yes gene_type:complete
MTIPSSLGRRAALAVPLSCVLTRKNEKTKKSEKKKKVIPSREEKEKQKKKKTRVERKIFQKKK